MVRSQNFDTRHFEATLKECSIPMSCITRTLAEPEKVEDRADGTRHFLRRIQKRRHQWLRVIVNITVAPTKLSQLSTED